MRNHSRTCIWWGNIIRTVTLTLQRCLLIYLLIPWSRVLLEKLTGFQLVKKFPVFYGTRRFITAFTSARHLSLSWASSIHSVPPHPTSWRSILILSSHLCLGLPSCLFPSVFPTKTMYSPLLSPIGLHAPPISLFSILSPEQYWVSSTDYSSKILGFKSELLPLTEGLHFMVQKENSPQSPASDKGNVSEPRLMSQVGKLCEGVCA